MSVTFYAELSPIVGHRVTCMCPAAQGITFGDYNDAMELLVELRDAGKSVDGCTEEMCGVYGVSITAIEKDPSPDLNVNGANARTILTALGIMDDEMVGGMEAEAFLGRVLMAEAVAPTDAGLPSYDNSLPGRRTQFIECGRPEGYLQDRLVALREIAEFGARTGREICWA